MTQGFFLLVDVVIAAILILQWLLTAARRQETGPSGARSTRVAAVVSNVVQHSDPPMPTDDGAPAPDHWYIECQWTDPRSDAVYTFRSAEVDAATAQIYAVGSPISVLIAPGAPDSYFVEIAEP